MPYEVRKTRGLCLASELRWFSDCDPSRRAYGSGMSTAERKELVGGIAWVGPNVRGPAWRNEEDRVGRAELL